MKEIFEAIESRIKSPVFGYLFLSFIAFNWDPLFFLLVSNKEALERIKYFRDATDFGSLIGYPILVTLTVSVIYPWVHLGVLKLIRKPNDLKNTLQAQSEHFLLIKQNELEKQRSELLSSAEKELIERAKRDVELEEIGDDDIKEKLKDEIEELRRQRDNLRKLDDPEKQNTSQNYKELMEMAKEFRHRADNTRTTVDAITLRDNAASLEAKAHKLMLGKNS